MFLAINELIKEKARFGLIVFVIFLVSYLTFFLTSLAYGLATSYTQGIDKWNATGLVLQRDANNTITRSLLFESDYKSFVNNDTAALGVGGATIKQDESKDVSIFGIESDGFLAPNIIDGQTLKLPHDIIVSNKLKDIGIKLDQTITFKGSDYSYRVVGFTDKATFQTAPIIYMTLTDWREITSDLAGMKGMKDDTTISAVVTRGSTDSARYSNDNLQWLSIRDFAFKLPGYQAQVLTFGLMIGFLIAIASFVLAVFMYILTLQKKSVFGVLKAEGVPNSYISISVMLQIAILSAIGLSIGLVTAVLSGVLLESKVPFATNPLYIVVIILLFLIFAGLGGLASVRAVTKIDPVKAIG